MLRNHYFCRALCVTAPVISLIAPIAMISAQETGPETLVGELPAVVVESAPSRTFINDRVPTPLRTETSSATYDTIEEPGKDQSLLGVAAAASMGQASAQELMARPYLRRGELLEVIPGMIITQHSGGGKANQYFVRGFNLDHGTDFGVFVDAMPVNHRSHGHGQGYADINFIIPELIEKLDYTKGPYYSDLGDFTTAGSARFGLYDIIPHGMANLSVGEGDYFRFLTMDSAPLGGGILSSAFEYSHYDGPWVLEEDFTRFNGFMKYYWETGVNRFSITGMMYEGEWTATDQIPSRLVGVPGGINRFGFIDPTNGGDSSRYSLSFDWIHEGDNSTTEVNAYVGHYDLDLFSNFTYFLANPAPDGDQFNQVDDRNFAGLKVTNTRPNEIFGKEGKFTTGFQSHHDWIGEVGLYNTIARTYDTTVRSDKIYESNFSGFLNQELIVNDWLKLNGGIRADLYYFDVTSLSGVPENSGTDSAGIVSPKFGAVFSPWEETELFANWGTGFHSNDARGVTISLDPNTLLPTNPVDALVRQWETEIGVRTAVIPKVTTSLALWYLESDSELVFIGDAGNTEAGPGTQRYGVEWATYWKPADCLLFDSELSIAKAELMDTTDGRYVENAVPVALSTGVTAGRATGPYGSLRARYFSKRPLTADKSVESRDSLVFNLRTGYRKEKWDVYVEVLNLLDTDANDIEYYYESRVPGDPPAPPDGIDDIHFHPMEPRTIRTGVTVRW